MWTSCERTRGAARSLCEFGLTSFEKTRFVREAKWTRPLADELEDERKLFESTLVSESRVSVGERPRDQLRKSPPSLARTAEDDSLDSPRPSFDLALCSDATETVFEMLGVDWRGGRVTVAREVALRKRSRREVVCAATSGS